MNSKKINRTRSFFAAAMGAALILGINAFAPKAEASKNHHVRYLYRNATFVNERAVERSNDRRRTAEAEGENKETAEKTPFRFFFKPRVRF